MRIINFQLRDWLRRWPGDMISIGLLTHLFRSAGLRGVLILDRLLSLLLGMVGLLRTLTTLLFTPIRVILVEQLERTLRWILAFFLFSFYGVINAGFLYLGYRITEYSQYLGVWAASLVFIVFTLVCAYLVLRIVQQVRAR